MPAKEIKINKDIQEAIDALSDLSNSVYAVFTQDKTFAEHVGWQTVPLNRTDLVEFPIRIIQKLKECNISEVSAEGKEMLKAVIARIKIFKATNLPQFSGNFASVILPYLALVEWIRMKLEPFSSWKVLADTKALPSALIQRLQTLQSGIDALMPEKDSLENQINQIKEATETSENLHVTMDTLKKASLQVDNLHTRSAEVFGKIDSYLKSAESVYNTIKSRNEEADKLVTQCYDFYRITTSVGLAGAFEERAKSLALTMYWWVAGLVASLIIAIVVGHFRFQSLFAIIAIKPANWGIIWLEVSLSVLGLAAPLWLAWLATRKIGQYFKLSEDYAFKASISKAYEGYRREAARIDEVLEAQLFASALSRLDEPPLRLVGKDDYSSPLQEFMTSDAFKEAWKSIPEFKDKFFSSFNRGIDKVTDVLKTQSKAEE